MNDYKYRDPKVEDGDWTFVEEDAPTSGYVGVPGNNPKRDPAWDTDYNWRKHVPQTPTEADGNVYFEYDGDGGPTTALERLLDDPTYNALIAAVLAVACVLFVWLLMVIT